MVTGFYHRYVRPQSQRDFQLTPYRTKSPALLSFWNKVRNIEDDIDEVIAKNGYSAVLVRSLFERMGDEIILCLNYDGLYGINNVNRFLQGNNPNPAVIWREATYKVGGRSCSMSPSAFVPSCTTT